MLNLITVFFLLQARKKRYLHSTHKSQILRLLFCLAHGSHTLRNNFNAFGVLLKDKKKVFCNWKSRMLVFPLHIAYTPHTKPNSPWALSGSHPQKKKSTFRNRNRFPFRLREPDDPPRSPIRFPGSFLPKFSATNTNASFANKVPITSYFIFSCFAGGGFFSMIFFPREFENKRKGWLLSFA